MKIEIFLKHFCFITFKYYNLNIVVTTILQNELQLHLISEVLINEYFLYVRLLVDGAITEKKYDLFYNEKRILFIFSPNFREIFCLLLLLLPPVRYSETSLNILIKTC